MTIAMPAVKELPWLKPSEISGDVRILTDPDHDHIPAGQMVVRSDTGELTRGWKAGIQTINTPRTQAASGWIGGKIVTLMDATFRFKTAKAVVALTSIDDQPLSSSRFILVTTVGQSRPSPASDMGKLLPNHAPEHLPYMTEPVVGTIVLKTKASGLELLALGPDGKTASRSTPAVDGDALTIQLPSGRGTHWYILKNKPPARRAGRRPPPAVTTRAREGMPGTYRILRPAHDAGSHRGTDSTFARVTRHGRIADRWGDLAAYTQPGRVTRPAQRASGDD